MLRILHGENTLQSRNELTSLIQQAKNNSQEILRLDAKKISLPELEQILGSTQLFGNSQLVIIDALHSLPKSKKKDALIAYVTSTSLTSDTDIILWEKRDLTATMLKKFPQAKDTFFKLSSQLFKWLDSFSPQNATKTAQLNMLLTAIEENGEQMCFIMLVRQVRLLIQVKSGGKLKGPPFMTSKMNKQAQNFSLDQLLTLHSQLLEIDVQMKTSKNTLSLRQNLDLLVINL